MAATVSLTEIIEALESLAEECSWYLDPETGQLCAVMDETLAHAENGRSREELPEWQRAEFDFAVRVLDSNRLLRLPSKFDIHEWEIMRDFSLAMRSAAVRDELFFAIHGGGAFRRFKAAVYRRGVQDEWRQYRDQALRQIAIEWCAENHIPYREE